MIRRNFLCSIATLIALPKAVSLAELPKSATPELSQTDQLQEDGEYLRKHHNPKWYHLGKLHREDGPAIEGKDWPSWPSS